MISWHRFYDPETGRYITADPIGLEGGINLYAYVGGNPVNAVDPMGLASYKEVESHFIFGVGALEITCCTEDGRELKHLYMKVCLGAAIEASGGVGKVSNSDGKSCSKPPQRMLGGEIGISTPIGGGQAGVSVGTKGEGVSGSAGGDVGFGICEPVGFKATACYYQLENTFETGKKCSCSE